jgi:uncharacterized protein YbjT (DUF2867 family)
MALGWIGGTIGHAKRLVDLYRTAGRDADHPDEQLTVGITSHFYVGETFEQALHEFYPYYHRYLSPETNGGRGWHVDRDAIAGPRGPPRRVDGRRARAGRRENPRPAHRARRGPLVYTSAPAPTTRLVLAAEHKATEEVVRASGIPGTFLRNGWYTENHRQDFTTARQHGVIANSIGTGRIATVPRRDYAEAAAAVLTTPGHEGKAYELSGDVAWDYAEFAAAAQKVLGTPIRYQPLSPQEERDQLLAGPTNRPSSS